MSPIRLTVGDILEERGINAAEFATMARLGYRTVLNLIKDRNDRIDLDTIAKVCKALEIEPGDFIRYEPED